MVQYSTMSGADTAQQSETVSEQPMHKEVDSETRDLSPAETGDASDHKPDHTESTTTTNNHHHQAHISNPAISAVWRYGLTVWLVLCLILLLVSDIGSGVRADTQTVPLPQFEDLFQSEKTELLEASVFTSVKELWKTESYALTVFIVIFSIAWPYIKLLLTLYAWVTTFSKPHRRERLLVWIDALGKWSFVDVVVFIEIVVVFRATIPVFGGTLEVWITPQWGLFGFITASMGSLIATHVALYHHRRIMVMTSMAASNTNKNNANNIPRTTDDDPQQQLTDNANDSPERKESTASPSPSSTTSWSTLTDKSSRDAILATILLVAGHALYLVGFFWYTFEITNTRQLVITTVDEYSMHDIGQGLDGAFSEEDASHEVYMAAVWYLLGLAMPTLTFCMFVILVWIPLASPALWSKWFFATEVAFAWGCGEVFLVSTLFAVKEIPKFGDGLVEVGCAQCYQVESELHIPAVVVWCIGVALSLSANTWILVTAHKKLYGVQSTTLVSKP